MMLQCRSPYSRCYPEFHRSAKVPANCSQTGGATRPKPYVHGPWRMFCSGLRPRHLVVLWWKGSSPGFTRRDSEDAGTDPSSRNLENSCKLSSCFLISVWLQGSANNVIENRPSRHKSRLSKISVKSVTATAPHSVGNSLTPGCPREFISQPEYLLPAPDLCICVGCPQKKSAHS